MGFLCCRRRSRAHSGRVLKGSSSDRQRGQPQASPVPLTANGAGNSPNRQRGQPQASLVSLTTNMPGNSPDKQRDQPQASPVPLTVNVYGGCYALAEEGRYTLAELNLATDSFSQDRKIGSGGFGKVYKGILSDGTEVAVKKRDPESGQGVNEFRAEIELCLGLSHPHLVSLLGYCDKGGEMILVYEYMEQGTLASHIYGSRSRLTWEQRLKILIEAAKGLHYLHTCSENGIIHRDVKSSNILLDGKFVAKIADFGLARIGPDLGKSHVTTEVKYTHGFVDLEYYTSRHLTRESDVFSFGVVMMEALCGRKAVEEDMGLAIWGRKKIKEGRIQEIVDQSVLHTIRPECLKEIGKIVKKCLARSHKDRPSMEKVISELNVVQKLQDKLSPDSDIGNSMPAGSSEISSPVSSGPCSPPWPVTDSESDSSDSSITLRSKRPGALPKYRQTQ